MPGRVAGPGEDHGEVKMTEEPNLKAALSLARWGIPCFPCGADKRPKVKWTVEATSDAGKIRHWWSKFPDALPALPTGRASGLCVIDLDVKNGKNGIEAYRSLGLDPTEAGAVVRTASGGIHLYFNHVEGLRNSQDRLGQGIDVRADGGYVIAPGATGPAGPYEIKDGHLDTIELIGVQPPDSVVQMLCRPKAHSSGKSNPSLADLKAALSYIPSDGSREDWIRILMALHAASEGRAEGLELAQKWSADYPDYDPAEVEEQWCSFRDIPAGGITVATLFHEAKQCGWRRVSSDDFDDLDDFRDVAVGQIEELNQRYALVRIGGNAAIADFRPNGDIEFMSSTAFREIYSNQKFGKKALGTAWITHPKRRTFLDGVVFDPSRKAGPSFLNLFRGFALEPQANAPFDLIHDHVVQVLASGNNRHADYIFSWLADIVQNPAEKPGVALVLKGQKGVGKDTLAEIMKSILGRRHSAHVASTQRLTARFNAAFATALLIHVEEAIWGGQQDAKGVVQSLITCPSLPLERKNVDTVEVDSYSRLLFTTNESWAVPATADERRYAVFEASSCRRNDRSYFHALHQQIGNGGLAGFLAFLQDWEAPEGVDLRDPPRTRGLMEQKLAGLRSVERWWYEVLSDGELQAPDTISAFDADEYSEDWLKSPLLVSREVLRDTYREWMRQMRYHGDPKGAAEFGEVLRTLCPELEDCRPTVNGRRVRKYRIPPLHQCRESFAIAMGGDNGDLSWTN